MKDLQEILISHIEKSNKFQDEAIKKLSAIETHHQYTHDRLDKVEATGEDYKKHKNIIYGTIVSLSVVWGFFVWLFKKLL